MFFILEKKKKKLFFFKKTLEELTKISEHTTIYTSYSKQY